MKKALKASCATLLLAGLSVLTPPVCAFEGLGRSATADEIKAWDIDVRPDFKGLPKGQGSVDRGMQVWEAQCASCHGVFGESNEVFTPIVGGTTAQDIKVGRVESLRTGSSPQRTTLMKVPTVSTLWDYINRAMPWTAPKSLSTDDVYAVTAYILNMGGVVGDDFVLSHSNMADVQNKLPNRKGMQTQHGMWLASGKPDVKEKRCMSNCVSKVAVVSAIPEYARDAHGNIADQNRLVGPVRGQQTVALAATLKSQATAGDALFNANGCTACHAVNEKRLGPSIHAVAERYAGKSGAKAMLARKIKDGGAGAWGSIPMPPHPQMSDADLDAIADWVLNKK